MTAGNASESAAVDDLARFLYEHECCGDSDGPWTDRRRDWYRRLAVDTLEHLGQRAYLVGESHYRGLDWDDPERSGTFCGNCLEPWPCPSASGQFGSTYARESGS